MPLNVCRECGEQVSDQAKTCPKCGIKTPVKLSFREDILRTAKQPATLAVAALVICWIIAGVISSNDEQDKQIKQSQEAAEKTKAEEAKKDQAAIDEAMKWGITFEQAKAANAKQVIASAVCKTAAENMSKYDYKSDWLDYSYRYDAQHIYIGKALSKYNAKEYHHIFPRAYLKNREFSREKINSLCNFCFLTSDSNKKISSKAPSDYFTSIVPQDKFGAILEANLMPLNRDIYYKNDFEQFLKQRSQQIMQFLDKQLL